MPTTPILASSKCESVKKMEHIGKDYLKEMTDDIQLPRVENYSQQAEKVHTDSI